MISANDVKASVDLRAFALQVAGSFAENQRTRGGVVWLRAPWRNERTASVIVHHTYFRDFGDGSRGDVFAFAMRLTGCSFQEAVEMVSGKREALPKLPAEKPQRKRTLDMATVRRYARNLNDARAYFTARGISEEMMGRHQLGAGVFRHFYHFTDGSKVVIKARRFTIPNIYRDKVLGVNTRLDEQDALRVWAELAELDREVRDAICADLSARFGEVTDRLVLDEVFKPKYRQLKGGRLTIFNAERLQEPQLFIVESELDALLLESLGYHAIALPDSGTIRYEAAFSMVQHAIILADGDEAGKAKADLFSAKLGSRAKVISPQHHKDIGEYYQANSTAARRFLALLWKKGEEK